MGITYPFPTKNWHITAQPATDPSRPELSAKGKLVLVTGGGNTGIGGETARRFAQAGAAKIGLIGRRPGPLAENKAFIEEKYPGIEVWTRSADVTIKEDMDKAFADFAGDKKIDVLVDSATVIGPKPDIEDADPKEYLDSIQANISAALYVSTAFLRHAAEDAVAIPISSWAAHWTAASVFSAYSVSKIAVFRLWDTIAFSHPRLSVFPTQPGVVLTELNLSNGGAASFGNIQDHDVSLPACFYVWLASGEARFLNRKYLWTNWDVEELKADAEAIQNSTKFDITLGGWPFEYTIDGMKKESSA